MGKALIMTTVVYPYYYQYCYYYNASLSLLLSIETTEQNVAQLRNSKDREEGGPGAPGRDFLTVLNKNQ